MDRGSSLGVAGYLVWDGSECCYAVSSARIHPALNGYLEKSGEGKQERYVKAKNGWPPTSVLLAIQKDWRATSPPTMLSPQRHPIKF